MEGVQWHEIHGGWQDLRLGTTLSPLQTSSTALLFHVERTETLHYKCHRKPRARGSKWCHRRCNLPATLRAAVPAARCESHKSYIHGSKGAARCRSETAAGFVGGGKRNPSLVVPTICRALCLSVSGLLSLGPVSWYPQASTLRASISLSARAEPAVAEARLEQLLDLGLW